MEREFKIDITLAAELAQFLEGILEADFNEELDAEAPVTDTYLDQFMPNGFVPEEELIRALIAAGVVVPQFEPEFDSAGFSLKDNFEDDDEGSHHCDDPGCNCSI